MEQIDNKLLFRQFPLIFFTYHLMRMRNLDMERGVVSRVRGAVRLEFGIFGENP